MGPAVPIRDLRIKLLIPPASGLFELPEEGWWDTWRAMPEHTRGHLRTSVSYTHLTLPTKA